VRATDLVTACLAVLRLVQHLADEQLGADRRDIVRVERPRVLLAGERLTVGEDDGELVLHGDPLDIVLAVAVLLPGEGRCSGRADRLPGRDRTAPRYGAWSSPYLADFSLDDVGATPRAGSRVATMAGDVVMPRASSGGWLPRSLSVGRHRSVTALGVSPKLSGSGGSGLNVVIQDNTRRHMAINIRKFACRRTASTSWSPWAP
jgi:hypothetical protein